MYNNLILIGRFIELENDTMKIAVSRDYKNNKGIYETDFIKVSLSKSLKESVGVYVRKGDIIGTRGRIETDINGILVVVAEKLTFLSQARD